MAAPRIFISSTYFDLRVIRADIERFIKEFGYEPILFERGHIPYGKEEALEDYCYQEIATCDILVAIIGGKFGSQSRNDLNSITQNELKTAIEQKKQIYIFIERSVLSEFRTYQSNKDFSNFKPCYVNDLRIYEFIEEVSALPIGNPIEPFELSEDITRFLKNQWAGLFQRLLQIKDRQPEYETLSELRNLTDTLTGLIKHITDNKSLLGDTTIREILLYEHPAFEQMKRILNVSYRVSFRTFDELDALVQVRGYEQDREPTGGDTFEWDNYKAGRGIRVKKELFNDDGSLVVIPPGKWDQKYITTYKLNQGNTRNVPSSDDIPF